MNAAVAEMVEEATAHWAHVAPLLKAPETEAEYERLIEALDEVLDTGGADENHELASLAERMGDLIAAYEDAHVPELDLADGIDVLKYLMQEHGLRQADLPEIGNQSAVSHVLNRNRDLTLPQMRRLSARFGLPVDAFLPR